MKKILFPFLLMLGSFASAQTPLINCPSGFTASAGPCQVVKGGGGPNGSGITQFSIINHGPGSLAGSRIIIMPPNQSHGAAGVNWMHDRVDVRAFTATFSFVPNGWNFALVFNNSFNNPHFNGAIFFSGAGCEGGFYQAFNQPTPPENVFAMMFDQWSSLTAGADNFTYSSVQTYASGQSPCNPNLGQPNYHPKGKISTNPVPLNSPVGAINTTTGDTYSATFIYDGSNLTLYLYDITIGGSCPGRAPTDCFTHTWTGVNIPQAVGGDTAWVGFTASTNSVVPDNLYLDSFVYTVNSGGIPMVATPTFSPVAGTYSTPQRVSISDTTGGATIYYTLDGETPTTSSSVFSEPLDIAATTTIKAIAAASGFTNSAVASATYTIAPVTGNVPISITINGVTYTWNATQQ